MYHLTALRICSRVLCTAIKKTTREQSVADRDAVKQEGEDERRENRVSDKKHQREIGGAIQPRHAARVQFAGDHLKRQADCQGQNPRRQAGIADIERGGGVEYGGENDDGEQLPFGSPPKKGNQDKQRKR
jgi:hypothetical protein